jgi:competence protein ComEA
MEYRKKHPFKKIEDIMNVKGIGKKIFENIKSEICIDCKE